MALVGERASFFGIVGKLLTKRIGVPNESAAAVRSSSRNRRFGFLFDHMGRRS